MIGKLDDYLQFNQAALNLRSQRQQVLASNIANADTPNFKARDIDFASALQGAMSAASPGPGQLSPASSPNAVVFSGAGAAQAGAAQAGAAPLLYRAPLQGAIDGNTVDMDVERNQFADNGIHYEAGITMLNAQIRNMMTAIQASP